MPITTITLALYDRRLVVPRFSMICLVSPRKKGKCSGVPPTDFISS